MFGIPLNWIIYLVIFLAGVGAGVTPTRIYYRGEIASMELAAAKAIEKARDTHDKQQGAVTAAAIDVSDHQVEVQVHEVTVTKTIVKEIPTYVKDTSLCITIGLIRVLDAAAIGADPADLALAPGEFNETCAGIGSNALATSVSENYGRARGDAAQLTDAQVYLRRIKAALELGQKP